MRRVAIRVSKLVQMVTGEGGEGVEEVFIGARGDLGEGWGGMSR